MSVVPRNNTQGLSLGGLEASLLSLPVLVGVALLSIIGAAAYLPLFDLDEGAFSEATREILASGNWVSTYLNGEPRHDKPILIYWFQASSVLLFGHEPWAYRLPSMLVAVVWVFAVYRFSREFYNERSARLAVWVLAVSLVASSIFKAATADALLNCLINLIFFDIYRYYCKPEQKQLYKIGLYMGLAFLTKGPIGVLLPLMAAFLCFAYLGRLALFFRAVFDPRAWATVLLVITPWHIAVYLDQGMDFFEGFYLGHNLGRYGQTMEGHGGSPLYYVLLLPVLLAPFSVQFFRLFREIKIAKNIDIDKVDALTVYLLTWFGLTLLLFSFSETQLPHYLLYGMTPVFLLVARRLDTYAYAHVKERKERKERVGVSALDLILACALVVFLSLLPFALEYAAGKSNRAYDAAIMRLASAVFYERYIVYSLIIAASSVAIVLYIHWSKIARLLLCAVLALVSFNFILAPVVAHAQQQPLRDAANFILSSPKHANKNIVYYKLNMPSFSVYLQRLVTKVAPKAGDLVITKISAVDSLAKLNTRIELILLFSEGGIALYQFGADHEGGTRE